MHGLSLAENDDTNFLFFRSRRPLIDALLPSGLALQQIRQKSREEKMARLPHVDSARRFFRNAKSSLDAKSGFHRPARLAYAAVAIGFGLALSCSSTMAQNAPKGTPDHIKAVTSAVDSASIKANTATSKDWPTYGLDYAETRFSRLN
jgi:hypothetical protein